MSVEQDARPDDGRDESPNERADRNWLEIVQELRVTQTGTQLISGFLLAVAFQARFPELDAYELALYLTLVGLAATSTLLGLALVISHRTHFGKLIKRRVVTVGNRLLLADIIVVIVLTAGVTSLIFDFAWNHTAGIIAFVVALVVAAGLWVIIIPTPGGAGRRRE